MPGPTAPARDPLAPQRRILLFTGVVLAAQLVNTLFLWRSWGAFPLWSGLATLGLTLFLVSALGRYRRTRALLRARSAEPKRKRRRLRDPHRKQR
jgi:hypothetical protein